MVSLFPGNSWATRVLAVEKREVENFLRVHYAYSLKKQEPSECEPKGLNPPHLSPLPLCFALPNPDLRLDEQAQLPLAEGVELFLCV